MTEAFTEPRSLAGLPVRLISVAIIISSVVGVVAGLAITQSLSRDIRASVSVSHSALEAISETIESIDEVAAGTTESIDSASTSVSSAASTLETSVASLEGVADFLDEELPETLESIQMSMPAAIQAANAVDGTLRALSFVGVDYDPEEPFGESLSRVNAALSSLPDNIRTESESLRLLIPSVERLSSDTGTLSTSLGDVAEELDGFSSLTATYEVTIDEAEATIVETSDSIDASIWIVRALIAGAGILGALVGLVLWSLAGRVEHLTDRVELARRDRELAARSE